MRGAAKAISRLGMRIVLSLIAGTLVGATLFATEVDAKRLGGARSIGVQRHVAALPAAPVRQAAAAPAPTGSRWLPALGALAFGGLLGSLLGGAGFGGAFLLVLLTFAALAYRWLRTRARDSQPLPPVKYGALAVGGVVHGARPMAPATASAPVAPAAKAPAGFDVAGFVRTAKLNFIKLQVANDLGDLRQIREFTTPDMFDALSKDLAARGGAGQQTEVVTLEAQLLEVATEGDSHHASLRFSGTTREAPGAPPTAFSEVWNLARPVDGSSGWLLAGIRQAH
ncbi:MAG: Tim44 domain-containing protein [Sphingomonadaceae bacterium]